jgi:hypothetical protein
MFTTIKAIIGVSILDAVVSAELSVGYLVLGDVLG